MAGIIAGSGWALHLKPGGRGMENSTMANALGLLIAFCFGSSTALN